MTFGVGAPDISNLDVESVFGVYHAVVRGVVYDITVKLVGEHITVNASFRTYECQGLSPEIEN